MVAAANDGQPQRTSDLRIKKQRKKEICTKINPESLTKAASVLGCFLVPRDDDSWDEADLVIAA